MSKSQQRAVAIAPPSPRPETDQTSRPVVSALRVAAEILAKINRFDGPDKIRTSRYGGDISASRKELDDADIEMARALMGRFEALPIKRQREIIACAVGGYSIAQIARRLSLPLPLVARDLEAGLDWVEGGELSYNAPSDFCG
jgi:DNA-directed RNA polymerase specialized sigma24 family protein